MSTDTLSPRDLADLHFAIRADRAAEVTGQAAPTERVEAVVARIKAEAARDARAAIVARLDARETTPAEPIVEFLPALREFIPAHSEAGDFDTCVVCRDGECGGACEGALYVVRQVMEAMDSPHDLPWLRDFLDMPERDEVQS